MPRSDDSPPRTQPRQAAPAAPWAPGRSSQQTQRSTPHPARVEPSDQHRPEREACILIILAMSSGLHVVRAGAGPHLLFIHGSATDHRTWSIQLASPLRTQFTLIAYDRRRDASVEAHADDAANLLAAEPGRGVVIGSSFG